MPLPSPTRRRLLLGGGALAGAAWVSAQVVGHLPMPARPSAFLGTSARTTLTAACEALLPEHVDADAVAGDVDGYLAGADPVTAEQLRLALTVLEHTGGVGVVSFKRFSRHTRSERADILERWLVSSLGVRRQIAHAVRKTVLFTYYSGPAAWEAIGYDGPLVSR